MCRPDRRRAVPVEKTGRQVIRRPGPHALSRKEQDQARGADWNRVDTLVEKMAGSIARRDQEQHQSEGLGRIQIDRYVEKTFW